MVNETSAPDPTPASAPAAGGPGIPVVHVCDKLSVGDSGIHGVARLFQWWFPRFAGTRYRPLLCVLRGRDRAGAFLESKGLAIEYLGRGKFDPRTPLDLARVLRRMDAKLLHLHGYGAWTFGRLVGRRLGLPVVLHEHISEARVPGVQRLLDRALARRDPVVAVADGVAAFCASHRGVRAEDIEVIPNGIPLEELRRLPPDQAGAVIAGLGLAERRPLLGVIGRLEARKGVEYAIRALAEIRRVHADAQLLVVGDGELRDALAQLASSLELAPAVHFLGFREDVASILSALDLLLIPSLTEGHPLTLLEAFATATPVVSSSAGGLGEAIDDGETALLVPPRDPAAMAAAALRVLADPALAARLGSNARAEAERRYDMRLAVDRLVALYDRLLDGASGPA